MTRTITPNAPPTPKAEFAQALSRLFEAAYLTPDTYSELGAEVAQAQVPPRTVPYGDYTVEGWASGALLPTDTALAALIQVLHVEYGVPGEALHQLDNLWENARDWELQQTNQPSELSHAYRVAAARSHISLSELTEKTAVWNAACATPNSKLSESKPGLSQIFSGKKNYSPSKYLTYAMERWTEPLSPPLTHVHEQMLRERGEALWETAAREKDFGQLIRAMRLRLGETQGGFGDQLAAIAGLESLSDTAVFLWEQNITLPCGGHSSQSVDTPRRFTEYFVHLMHFADAAPTHLGQSLKTPWFTPEKERVFHDLLEHRLRDSHDDIGHAAKPAPPPTHIELRDFSYAGSLSNTLTGMWRQ